MKIVADLDKQSRNTISPVFPKESLQSQRDMNPFFKGVIRSGHNLNIMGTRAHKGRYFHFRWK